MREGKERMDARMDANGGIRVDEDEWGGEGGTPVSRTVAPARACVRGGKRGTPREPVGARPGGNRIVWSGDVLLSHTLSGAVPSPCKALASGFGMGPGVSPWLWSPQIFNLSPPRRGDGGMWRFGNRTMDANSFRGPNGCSLPGEQAEGRNTGNAKNNMACCVIAFPPLVPVSSTPCGASTSGLSTTCSAWGVARPEAARNPNLGAGFPLRCFQRLSLPNVANRPCRWRDNRHTRGSSTQVLSYYGQASSGFQRAQRIETKLSHDVLNPARVPL